MLKRQYALHVTSLASFGGDILAGVCESVWSIRDRSSLLECVVPPISNCTEPFCILLIENVKRRYVLHVGAKLVT